MASVQDPSFPLRLFVDKKRNRVVMAEASGDFVDTLFSFLTLPLGTIIRLASKNQNPSQIGCINNLYHSVKNCDTQIFWNEICKKMLLCPRNPCEALCQKLKLKVDDTEPANYWMCGFCVRNNKSDLLLSTFRGASRSCGKVMDKEVKLQKEDSSKEEAPIDGVFVKRDTMYMIFDDLMVLRNSATDSIKQLVQLDYTDFNNFKEMFLNVGSKEILGLLKRALISKSPLSDVFLDVKDGGSKSVCFFTPKPMSASPYYSSIYLKIIVSKSKNKIIYAEAEAEFFDFLFSFLTIPIGAILNLLNDNVLLGSIYTLHKSVMGLNSSYFTEPFNNLFQNLQVAPQHGCNQQPIQGLHEKQAPSYFYDYVNSIVVISKYYLRDGYHHITLFDPRSPPGDKRERFGKGFVRRPSLFVVTDDLQVTPLTSTSSFLFMQKLDIPLDDLEEHTVQIGNNEALNLLRASLTSKTALTDGLFNFLKKPKEEATL